MHPVPDRAAPGLFRKLRDGADPGRQGHGIDLAKEPAKRARQRLLFLPVRRPFGGGRDRRMVLHASAFFDLVYRWLQRGLYRLGNLVWPDCAETEFLGHFNFFDRALTEKM